MKNKIVELKKVTDEKILETFSIVSFGWGADDYRDYLVVEDDDEQAYVIDLDNGTMLDNAADSMGLRDIEMFLRNNVDRSGKILRVIESDKVVISNL